MKKTPKLKNPQNLNKFIQKKCMFVSDKNCIKLKKCENIGRKYKNKTRNTT